MCTILKGAMDHMNSIGLVGSIVCFTEGEGGRPKGSINRMYKRMCVMVANGTSKMKF